MNGYLITKSGTEALAAFAQPGVRHAARLDTGEGFVAFDGPIPTIDTEATVFEVVENAIPWSRPQVRRTYINPEDRDHLGLFTSEAFRALPQDVVLMASALSNDMVLAITTEPQNTANWSATSTEWLDIRAKQAVLA